MCRSSFAVSMLLLLSCGGDDAPASTAKPAAADPCVAVRAEYFRQEQYLLIAIGAAGGGAPDDPRARALLANYKLDNAKCFF